jgi:hypothetical protein
MFMGVAVDGSTSFVPGQSTPYEDISSDDEEECEEVEADQLTPSVVEARGPAAHAAHPAYAVPHPVQRRRLRA